VAVIDADKCASAFTKLNVPILGVVENMSQFIAPDGSTHALFGAGGGAKLAAKYGAPLLGQLPLDPAIGLAGDAGMNYVTQANATRVFAKIVAKILV
jgi:ATP-binding protein involved in chromosome partitioning